MTVRDNFMVFVSIASIVFSLNGAHELTSALPSTQQYQRPHFDSVLLSGLPMKNGEISNQHDARHQFHKQNSTESTKTSTTASNQDNNLEQQHYHGNKSTTAIDGVPLLRVTTNIGNIHDTDKQGRTGINSTNSANDSKNSSYLLNVHERQANPQTGKLISTNNTTEFYIPKNDTKNIFKPNSSRESYNKVQSILGKETYLGKNPGISKTGEKSQNTTIFTDTPTENSEEVKLPKEEHETAWQGQGNRGGWRQRQRGRWPARNSRRPSGNQWGNSRRPNTGWKPYPNRRPSSRYPNSRRPPNRYPSRGGYGGGSSPNPIAGGGSPVGAGNVVGGTEGKTEQGDMEFEQESLEAHNNFRYVHNAPAMTLNRELSQQAKAYAEKIALMGALQHSSNAERGQDVGENLAMGCKTFGVPLTGKEAVTNWYNEVCQYNFNNPGFDMNTGHFTQVVWTDSTELGIGKATGQMQGMPCVYVVGRYRTAGNFNNLFPEKVLRGNFDQSYCNNVGKG